MGVGGLELYLRERNLIREAPLSALKDTRLGIDANQWFGSLLADPRYQEPCVSVTGGSPLNAYPVMEKQLRALEACRIKPVFVFHGLWPLKRERPFNMGGGAAPDADQQRLRVRDQGWDRYVQQGQAGAMPLFAQSSSVQPCDVLNQIHRLFRTRQVEYLVAPYLAWAQLVYLERHPKAYVHATYGSTELLMFEGVERLILSVDFDRSLIRFVNKSAILADLGGISNDQFLDMAVLSGFDHSPLFPFFAHTAAQQATDYNFRQAAEFVRQYRQGLSVVQAYSDFAPVSRTGYADQFLRARSWIKLSLVTAAEEGRVVPLPVAISHSLLANQPGQQPSPPQPEVPTDLHELFTFRFPDEVYFQLCRAMISPSLLNVLASGQWVEPPPLCGGETEDYTSFVQNRLTQDPTGTRCVALALVGLQLHPIWQQKPVYAIYYFEPHRDFPVPYMSQQTISLVKRVTSGWKVPAVVVEEELKRQNSSTIDILLCLGATSDTQHAARTRTPARRNDSKDPSSSSSKANRPLEKKDEVVANALWRLLELRGFLGPDHAHTPLGSALYKALKGSKVNDKLQEPLLLVIELIRAEVLHAGRYGGRSWVGSAHRGSQDDQRCMLLVMRTLSVLPLQFKPMAWQGPLSRDLLVFNSFLRSLSRSLRLLVEATVLSLVLRNDARRSREDGMEVGLSLPFQAEANTGMGILFKGYADMMLQERDEKAEELGADEVGRRENEQGQAWGMEAEELATTKADILEGAQEGFPMVRDVVVELNRGFRFWDAVMTVARSLRDDRVVSPDRFAQFEAADRWLVPLRLQ